MSTVEALLEQARALSDEDRALLVRALARENLIRAARRIESGPNDPLPLSDEEIDQLVHEARGEMLRARGL